jgi:ferredoxin
MSFIDSWGVGWLGSLGVGVGAVDERCRSSGFPVGGWLSPHNHRRRCHERSYSLFREQVFLYLERDARMMKVRVESSRCQGHMLCTMLAPDSFELSDDDGRARAVDEVVPGEREADVLEASEACPEHAILVGLDDQ